ncbi:hypothetical protein SiH_1573 [Sulfolobus islandicus HVE10/4]|uniref:Uncharacterized protein n=1 Tax=Saccharolobus islandicus (strain HVE10/4) TaxID=930943 RepID=F0NRC0_SACI0|nr:hypothetical protein SiH_1573 [Sulfolobus islandicus HVE10/4]
MESQDKRLYAHQYNFSKFNEKKSLIDSKVKIRMGAGDGSARNTFIMGQLVAPHHSPPPISTSVKTHLKIFLFLFLSIYYPIRNNSCNNSNNGKCVTPLLQTALQLFSRKDGR